MDGLSANVEVNRRAYNRTSNSRNYIGVNSLSTQAAYSEGSFVLKIMNLELDLITLQR